MIKNNFPDSASDDYRPTTIVKLFSVVGVVLTGALAVPALTTNATILAYSLIAACMLFVVGLVVQIKTGNTSLSSNIVLYSLIALLIYLVYSGGVNNTGPLWIYIVGPVALFLHGLKRGLLDLAVLLIAVCILLFASNGQLLATSYEHDFKVRLLLSFLTVIFLSSVYEYYREVSYRRMLEISQEFEQLAKIDPLTKLSNRRDAMEKLEYEYSRMQRTMEPLSVLLLDLDYFKAINDTYGHDAGDQLLISIASLFHLNKRAQDTVSRWGGEEFLFILPQTDTQQAQQFAEKLHQELTNLRMRYQNEQLNCTMSGGIAELSKNYSLSEVLRHADEALYKAKESGRNKTCQWPIAAN